MPSSRLPALDATWKFVALGSLIGLALPAVGVALHGALLSAGVVFSGFLWHFTVAPLVGGVAGWLVGRASRDLRRRRQRLGKQAQEVTAVFEKMATGVFRTTVDGRILFASQALADMLGFPSPEAMRRVSATSLYATGQDRTDLVAELRQAGAVYAKPIHLVRNGGGRAHLNLTAYLQGEEILGILSPVGDARDRFLQLCSNCDRVHRGEGRWQKMSRFLTERPYEAAAFARGLKFSHGLCPACGEALYGQYWSDDVTGRLSREEDHDLRTPAASSP